MITYVNMTECLACGSGNLENFCSLGEQPLANNLKNNKEEPDELFPLDVNVCKNCYHSQLSIAVDRNVLYKHYLYVSGVSKTLAEEFDTVAELIYKENQKAKRILDIACNDGTFLKSFRKFNLDLWGIDPAENLIKSLSQECFDMTLLADYFPTKDVALQFPKMDIITCFNVVAHVPDPLSMLKGCKEILSEDGSIYIQTSQKEMILNGEFDTIYHEHHSFFTIKSMRSLAESAGLKLHMVSTRPVHGKSYLFVLKHESSNDSLIDALMQAENDLYKLETYKLFNEKVQANRARLVDVIDAATKDGKKVIGYGAAAKGVVMCNFHKLPHNYIIDETPLKIYKVIAGVNIPIFPPTVLENEKDDLVIIVYAWNFFDEIRAKILKMRPNNNDLIVPSLVKN